MGNGCAQLSPSWKELFGSPWNFILGLLKEAIVKVLLKTSRSDESFIYVIEEVKK
jgi:hypothetical protein